MLARVKFLETEIIDMVSLEKYMKSMKVGDRIVYCSHKLKNERRVYLMVNEMLKHAHTKQPSIESFNVSTIAVVNGISTYIHMLEKYSDDNVKVSVDDKPLSCFDCREMTITIIGHGKNVHVCIGNRELLAIRSKYGFEHSAYIITYSGFALGCIFRGLSEEDIRGVDMIVSDIQYTYDEFLLNVPVYYVINYVSEPVIKRVVPKTCLLRYDPHALVRQFKDMGAKPDHLMSCQMYGIFKLR